jgi:hypothetical protein
MTTETALLVITDIILLTLTAFRIGFRIALAPT